MIGVIKGTMRQKKEVNGLPLPIASYNANLKAPIRSLKVAITAKQSGSGTPSPDNIRPISGVSSVKVCRTGINLEGGLTLANDIQAYIPSATIDTTNKYVSFAANASTESGYSIFDKLSYKFKENTAYTFIFAIAKSNTNTLTNMRINFTDGSYSTISIPEESITANTKYTFAVTYGGVKTIERIIKSNQSGTSYLYYDECGVFEGTLTTSDFVAFDDNNVITINLGQTVYACYLNLTTGLLTIFGKYLEFDAATYYGIFGVDDAPLFYVDITGEGIKRMENTNREGILISNMLTKTTGSGAQRLKNYEIRTDADNVPSKFYFRIDSCTSQAEIDTFFADKTLQVVVELATPITVQLTPAQIEQLLINNVWADTGDVEELIYTDRQVYYGR